MFRGLTVYQLTQAIDAVLKRLDAALESKPFAPCSDKQAISRGFVKPLGEDTATITWSTNGGTLFCLRTDEKKIPAAAVRERVEAIRKQKEADGAEFNKTDERIAKMEITEGFLPHMPAATSLTYAYIDRELGMLFVGASEAGADDFVAAMKGALAGTPFQLLGIEDDPCDKFTAWVKDSTLLGDCFSLGTTGAIKHPGQEGGCGIINLKFEDMNCPEILSLIEAGREVCSVSLVHEDMDFRLTSSLGIRSISLGEDLKADTYDEEAGRPTTPNEFAAFVPAMRDVMRALEPLLGGWPKQEILDLEDSEAAA